MKLTLTITASANALARILETLSDDDVDVVAVAPQLAPVATPQPVPVAVMPEVVAAAPTISGEPEFDSTGLAWDERIHSKQKGQTSDGKWRKQRGVDDAFYKAVEAELRARYNGHVPAPTPIPPMPINPMGNEDTQTEHSSQNVATVYGEEDVGNVANEAPQPVPIAMPMPVAAPQPVPIAMPTPVAAPQPVPVAAPQPVPVATNEPITFHTVMMHVGTAMASGNITPDYLVQLVNEINQQCGTAMQSFTDMAAFPQAVEYCWAAFARDGKL